MCGIDRGIDGGAGGVVGRRAGGRIVVAIDPSHRTSGAPTSGPGSDDPVRRRRRQVAHWTLLANRIGYLVLALAMALFVIAFVVGFSATMATLVIVCLIMSFVLLAPSIVLGYAVKAAERDDVERGL
jgi:hypothetical protein